jgi:hypothetical protein
VVNEGERVYSISMGILEYHTSEGCSALQDLQEHPGRSGDVSPWGVLARAMNEQIAGTYI